MMISLVFYYDILVRSITVIVIKKIALTSAISVKKSIKILRSQSGRFILVVSGFRPK